MKTTIQISTENKEKIELFKGNTFDEKISSLLKEVGGYYEKIDEETREKVALQLAYIGYDAHDNVDSYNELEVSWLELFNSKVGDEFKPEKQNYTYYEYETAKAIYKNDDYVVLEIGAEYTHENDEGYDTDLVKFTFF